MALPASFRNNARSLSSNPPKMSSGRADTIGRVSSNARGPVSVGLTSCGNPACDSRLVCQDCRQRIWPNPSPLLVQSTFHRDFRISEYVVEFVIRSIFVAFNAAEGQLTQDRNVIRIKPFNLFKQAVHRGAITLVNQPTAAWRPFHRLIDGNDGRRWRTIAVSQFAKQDEIAIRAQAFFIFYGSGRFLPRSTAKVIVVRADAFDGERSAGPWIDKDGRVEGTRSDIDNFTTDRRTRNKHARKNGCHQTFKKNSQRHLPGNARTRPR